MSELTGFPSMLAILVEERVHKIIAQLVTDYRNGKLDGQAALNGVAEISAARRLNTDLANRITKPQV